MQDLLQRQGYAASGVSQVLALAGAPKGVLYHHFPSGKGELAQAAISASAARVLDLLDRLFTRQPHVLLALDLWIANSASTLSDSQFARGCPLATIALEAAATDDALQATLAEAFTAMRARIALQFERSGVDPARAATFAALTLSAYEGGLLLSRAARSTDPLLHAMRALRELFELHLGAP